MRRVPTRAVLLCWILCLPLAWACQGPGVSGTAGDGAVPDDVRAFFRNPSLAHPALSPDGERLAGVITVDGQQVLVQKRLRERKFRFLRNVGRSAVAVRVLGWSGRERLVAGFEEASARRFDRSPMGGMLEVRWLERRSRQREDVSWVHPLRPGFPEPVLHWLPDDPERILMAWWEEGRGTSVELVTVRSGTRTTRAPASPWIHTYYPDRDGAVRVARGTGPDRGDDRLFGRLEASGDFEPLPDPGLVSGDALEFVGYGDDPSRIYVRAYRGGEHLALFVYDLARGELGERVYTHPQGDVRGVIQDPADGRLLGVEVEGERTERVFFDESAARRQASIDAAFPDSATEVFARDREGRRALLRVSSATRPPEVYLYEIEEREAIFLFSSLPELDPEQLSPMRAVRYPARDGYPVPAYLTLPPGGASQGLPAIVIPHDGPSARDRWGWDALVQFLASRGFAVLQPNYRGSTGLGLSHERAGEGEWGGVMQRDVIDGARWLVEQGIADPARLGLYGSGYGGYSALLCAVQEPALFRAVASYGALTDLVALRDHPEHFRTLERNLPEFGDLPRHTRALARISPAHRAGELRAAVLVAHGQEDPRVHPSQAQRLIEALEAAGAVHESRLYRDEAGHFSDEDRRIDFHQRLVRFFEAQLVGGAPPGPGPVPEPL